ncbi:uncharacterized protein N7525_003097 [Penicillium rubens]|uniref:uncharacterized protein n=1 Tax=Penicillium rubens TaxID=1108849 RepID=UPI002A5A06F1|nr:uncharacterized protein N7525_003097 [Penicillium rubens]KAJ5837909.1 hypothetical protein N7525_003097 [Penicillium rubens]
MSAVQTITMPTQPDIQYHPEYEKFKERTRHRKETETLQSTLPENFPEKLVSPLVWEGKDVEKRDDWVYQLSDDQLDELDAALKSFKALNLSLGHINQSTFPLPTLRPVLRDLSKEIHTGRGFVVLRGLRIDDYSREDNIIIYTGVSSHIGNIRGRQQEARLADGSSPVISHIKDLTRDTEKNLIGAPSNTADKQVFHTDAGDIISLLCLNRAAEGGESYLSSSWHVYNILAKERPDLIHTLSQDWPVDGFNNPARPYSLLREAVLHWIPGSAPVEGYPPITEAQAEALDALHFLAEEHSAALDFQKGDVQYVNNLSIFHARNGFRDEPGKERHLLRLWLRDPENAWETPRELQERWDIVYKDVVEDKQAFPLEPTIRKNV